MTAPPPPPEVVTIRMYSHELLALARLLDTTGCVQRSANDAQRELHPQYNAAQRIADAAMDLVHESRSSRRAATRPERFRNVPPEVSP